MIKHIFFILLLSITTCFAGTGIIRNTSFLQVDAGNDGRVFFQLESHRPELQVSGLINSNWKYHLGASSKSQIALLYMAISNDKPIYLAFDDATGEIIWLAYYQY